MPSISARSSAPASIVRLFEKALFILLALLAAHAASAQALWVNMGGNGLLQYHSDNVGNHLPDFSFAGYEGGGVPLPVIPVADTISPTGGDDTSSIQNAINTVSAMPTNSSGYRGAVLLNPGTYTIGGTLTMSAGGVVLRGSGNNPATGTVLLVTNLSRNVLTVGGSSSWTQVGGTYTITDTYLPLGSTNLHIANAAAITWGTNVTVVADTDVFTDGTFQYAYNWSGTNVTVNGVTFTGTTSSTPGNVTVGTLTSHYQKYTSSSSPFSSLSVAYQSMLVGSSYDSSPATGTITLNNLTTGRSYAVQVWVNDPRGGSVDGRTATLTGNNQVTLAYNVPATTGGVGQYSIGTFTATAGTQSFTLASTSSPQINAILVSDITSTGYQPVNPATNLPSGLAVGDFIIIQRPQTQPWINAIGMNLLTQPWSPGTGLEFERQITAINGNQITVDCPLCNPIEQVWSTGQVFQVTDSARLQQMGVENLCAIGQIADYPSNILNGTFMVFQNLKNGWAHDLYLAGWGNGINLGNGTKWCTVQDCLYTNPATGTASAAPACWTIDSSGAQDLFQRCNSGGGYYHIMVTQDSTPGPNVFLNFNCTGTHYNGGPHQRWAAGVLHDDIIMANDTEGNGVYTPYLAINNRGNDGSGQGWAAGFSVMYNCQVPQFQLEEPTTTTNHYNWAIGGSGSEDNYSDKGIYDTIGTIVSPHSLYLEQLKERKGPAAVLNIGYQVFTIGATPATNSITPGSPAAFTVNVAGTNYFTDTISLAVSGLPAGATPSFSTNSITGTGASTLTISTTVSTPSGNYPLTISGIDGNLTNTATVNLVIGNFGLSAVPPSQSISAGTTNISYTINVTTNTGFSGSVALGIGGLPLNSAATLIPGSVAGAGSSTLTIYASNSTPAGTYNLTIYGTNGVSVASTPATLIVTRGQENLVWDSTSSALWDITTSYNWFNLGLDIQDQFYQNDNVLFDDTPGVVTNINITTTVDPGAITNNSSTNNFSFGGAGSIGGGASIVKMGSGTLTLSNANSFTGPVTVLGGTLKAGNSAALGAQPGSSTYVTNGATLDFNGFGMGAKAVVASGAGVGGNGAIVNNGASQTVALLTLTLAGDTTFGGSGRWDMRNSAGTATLNTLPPGSPCNITKIGPNQVSLVAVTSIDSAIGNINVEQGEFAIQTTTAQIGDPTKTLTVFSNATLETYQLTTAPLNKKIVFNGGAIVFGEKGPSIISGPVNLNGGTTTFIIANNGTPPTLTLSNNITGTGGFILEDGGNLVLAGTNTYSGATQVLAGILYLTNNGSISSTPLITVSSPGVLDATGRGDATATVASGQTLDGNGEVSGNLTVNPGATLATGTSGGGTVTFDVTGALSLQGTTVMKLNPASASGDVIVPQSVNYGGTLILTNIGGTYTNNASFTIFSAGGYGGGFTNILPAIPRSGLAWNTNALNTNGTLFITTGALPPSPSISSVRISSGNLTLSGSNGVRGGTYYVLTSTNAAVPVSTWQSVATNYFDPSGNFSWSTPVTQTSPARFYLLELQ
jgi:autotransporter-associated beta strand protein